jgi:hypothetical protein
LGKPRKIKKAKEKLITNSAAGQRTKKEFNSKLLCRLGTKLHVIS